MRYSHKKEIVDYVLKHNENIKEVDYAIPLAFANAAREIGINLDFYVTAYYKDGFGECINILDAYFQTKKGA